ncbi:proteasome assembly chaperone family protein [Candidatus Micrarchaeota archaeon]|nr:proteasome assembly chaperone family protein [Candidatus Micrarchaeota archaeon]
MGGMKKIEFKKLMPMKAKNATVIVGFPTSGLVGSIAASYLTSKLDMDFVGYYTSDKIPPVTAIHDYKPLPPIRVYASEEKHLVVILSEIVVPISISMEMAKHIAEMAEKVNSPMVITLGGISQNEEEHSVYAISTDNRLAEDLVKRKLVKKVREGATTGVVGLLLFPDIVKRPVLALLGEAETERPDPGAAVDVLHVLSKIIEVEINTDELEKEAELLAQAASESVISSKLLKRKLGSMYG